MSGEVKSSPKISIIMGIYNCADTLAEAIESILQQTYTDWELIMCDDGSKDDTYTVAQAYVSQYPDKIVLIRNEVNMGLNATLNNCLAHARGEYIARMDGDDISIPERFEKEVAVLETEPDISVVSCSMIYFDETGSYQQQITHAEYPEPRMLLHGTVHCHAPSMSRAAVMKQVGGYSVDKRLLRVEDWHLWLKFYAGGYRGKNLAEPLYKMRDDQSAVQRRKFKFRLNEAHVVCLAVKMLKLNPVNYVYALRPILVGLLPKALYTVLHRRKMKKG